MLQSNNKKDEMPVTDGDVLMQDYVHSMIFQNADGTIFDESADGTEASSPQVVIHNMVSAPVIYNPEQVMAGMKVEFEHNDLTQGDPVKIAEIVKAHLDEDPEYYTKLEKAGL